MQPRHPQPQINSPLIAPSSLSSPPPPTRAALTVTAVTTFATLWILLYPFQLKNDQLLTWLATDTHVGKIDAVTNIILFIPLGLAAGWLAYCTHPKQSPWLRTTAALALGAAASLLAETAQVWFHERQSAMIDLITNSTGTLIGALIAARSAPSISHKWTALTQWLSTRPVAQQAAAVIALAVVARAWPFDLWPEKFYLRMELFETIRNGAGFRAWRLWQSGTGDAQDAWLELTGISLTFLVLAAVTFAIGRAIHESAKRHGDTYQPVGSILFVTTLFAMGTELLQWPIRSRTMDPIDLAAAMLGIAAGLGADWAMRWRDDTTTHAQRLDQEQRAAARRILLRASLVVTAALFYASVVPLEPIYIPLNTAIETFKQSMIQFNPRHAGRVDFPLNAMAFGALAFMWMGAAGTTTRSRSGWVLINILVWIATVAFGASMEFAQVYFPQRLPNTNDVIAQAIGATGAMIFWWLGGVRLLEPVARSLTARGPALVSPLLHAYLAAYLFYAIMPLDLILSPGELRYKFFSNQIAPNPFNTIDPALFLDVWRTLRDITLAIPLGALFAVRADEGKRPRNPILTTVMLMAAIEFLHIFLLSRVAATLDIFIGITGVWIGLQLTRRWPNMAAWPPRRCAAAALAYATFLIFLHATPFDFSRTLLNTDNIKQYLQHIPFAPLHFSPPFPALDDVMFAALLALPLGVLLRAWQINSKTPFAKPLLGTLTALLAATALYAVLGITQLSLISRDPETTELISALIGAYAGIVITTRILTPQLNMPPQPTPHL